MFKPITDNSVRYAETVLSVLKAVKLAFTYLCRDNKNSMFSLVTLIQILKSNWAW